MVIFAFPNPCWYRPRHTDHCEGSGVSLGRPARGRRSPKKKKKKERERERVVIAAKHQKEVK